MKLVQKAFSAAFGRDFFQELQEFVGAVAHMFHDIQLDCRHEYKTKRTE